MSTPAAAFAHLIDVLDRLDVAYAVAGSVASSSYGFSRTTMDIDLVVDLPAEKIPEFTRLLGSGFYSDADQIRDQFAIGRAANIIHIATAWKMDLFPLGRDPYSQLEFERLPQKPSVLTA